MKITTRIIFIMVMLISMSSRAQVVVFDPSVYGEAVLTAENTLQQVTYLKQQLNAIKHLNTNQYQWSNVQALINNLGNVIVEANGIAYNAQNVDAQFKQNYPGYQAPTNYTQQYQQIVNNTLNTLNGVLQTMGSSAQDFQNENTRLAFLQAQSQSAIGQTQAIQAAAQIASEQVSQTQLLRQTLMAQTNSQTTYYAAQLQKDADEKAELEQVVESGSTTSPPIGGSGNSLHLPNLKE